jgi:hypothetical protein
MQVKIYYIFPIFFYLLHYGVPESSAFLTALSPDLLIVLLINHLSYLRHKKMVLHFLRKVPSVLHLLGFKVVIIAIFGVS